MEFARSARAGSLVGVTTALCVLWSAPAFAHRLSRGAAEMATGDFLLLGVKHMLLGWDHLLFIAGVLLLATSWQGAAKLITVFVIGHSLTLILGTALGWQLNPGLVDLVIAGSVIFVGGLLAMRSELDQRILMAAVAGFGLVHGLGLATQFQQIGLSENVLSKVLLFNVGVEIGQLLAIAAMTLVGKVLGLGSAGTRGRLAQPLGLGVVAGGVLALALAAYSALFPRIGDVSGYVPPTASSCEVEINSDPLPEGAASANPPLQEFFGPDQQTPSLVFDHARSDGYLTILYPATASAEELQAMEEFVTSTDGIGVLAGPAPGDRTEYRFTTYHEIMRCASFEADTMRDFAQAWFRTL